MPTITPNNNIDWIAEEINTQRIRQAVVKGLGMQSQLDGPSLKRLGSMQPGDTFDVTYTIDVDNQLSTARLKVQLDDPHGLFAGHTIVAVLGQLVSQIVEHRLAGEAPLTSGDTSGPWSNHT